MLKRVGDRLLAIGRIIGRAWVASARNTLALVAMGIVAYGAVLTFGLGPGLMCGGALLLAGLIMAAHK